MVVLATMNDAVTISLWGINLAVSVVLTGVLSRVAAAQRKYERLEDDRDKKVVDLQTDLHATTEKLVDSRFREMSHELRGSINGLVLTIETMKQRVEETEEGLTGIGEGGHTLEIKLLNGLNEIKHHVVEKAASKDDLKEHQRSMDVKVDRIQEHLRGQDVKMAQIEQRLQLAKPGGRP